MTRLDQIIISFSNKKGGGDVKDKIMRFSDEKKGEVMLKIK